MVNEGSAPIYVEVVDQSRGDAFGSRHIPAMSARLVYEGPGPPEEGMSLVITDDRCTSQGSIPIFNADRVVVQLDENGSLSYGTEDAVVWEGLADAESAECR
jgi:hypothetical protein